MDGRDVLDLALCDDNDGQVCGKHDRRHDRGRDGQHEGNDPRQLVVHETRGGDRQEREEREACRNWVQHEQDGEALEDEVRQVRLVRHDGDGLRVDCITQLWTDALTRAAAQRTDIVSSPRGGV